MVEMKIGLLLLASVSAAELNIRIVDAFRRPLSDVAVTVRCAHRREIGFWSDQAGTIRATYQDCVPSFVIV